MDIDEAIERFEKQQAVAQIMLNSEFGALPGERDQVHRERKELAEWALKGLHRLKEEEEAKYADRDVL